MTTTLTRRALLLTATMAALGAATARPLSAVRAQPSRLMWPDWQPATLAEPVQQLVLADGAIYAVTRATPDGAVHIWRSRTAGDTWEQSSVPATEINDFTAAATQPNHLLIATPAGVYQSDDGARSWTLTLPAPATQPAVRVAISPADPAVAYAVTAAASSATLWRSLDGGRAWQELRRLQGSLCSWTFPIVEPDPYAREGIYTSYYCAAGRSLSAPLTYGNDLWQTDGQPLLTTGASGPTGLLFPQQVRFTPIGFRGLVNALRHPQAGGSILLATEDGGASWYPLLEMPPADAYLPSVAMNALAATAELDQVFVGLSQDGRGVLGTSDGGTTWGPVSPAAIGQVRALLYHPASDRLFAGTDRGLWTIEQPASRITPPTEIAPWPSTVLPALEAGADETIGRPHALARAASGTIVVATQSRLIELPPDGAFYDVPPATRPAVGFVASAPDGSIVFTEQPSRSTSLATVQRITPERMLVTLAGGGRAEPSVEPQPATSVRLSRPAGIAIDAQGHVYVADSGHHVVLRIDPDGSLRIVAGTGRPGWGGDGQLATETDLEEPWGLEAQPDGRLLIVDRAGQRVVRLEADGTLWTVAGIGAPGRTGDGGPAVAAALAWPSAIAADANGRIYIADTLNQAVRVIDLDGTIWTVTDLHGAAPFTRPAAVAWDGGTGVYVADLDTSRVTWLELTL